MAHQGQALGAAQVTHDERKRQVLRNGHVRIQRIGLKDDRHVARLGRQTVDDLPVHQDMAPVMGLQAGHDAEKRRFSAAGRAEDGDELALFNRQVDAPQDRCVAK